MKVISLKNIEEFYSPNQQELVLHTGQIITPSAKDWLSTKGVKVVYTTNSVSDSSQVSNKSCDKEQLIRKISHLVISQYGITDSTILSTIVSKVIKYII